MMCLLKMWRYQKENNVLLETPSPNEVMQESQILTTPEKGAKEGEPSTQIEYVIKENEVIINEKENICIPPRTKQYGQSKERAKNLLRLIMY